MVVAGIALLREQKVKALASDNDGTVPEELLSEAALLHPYAVAAYTVLYNVLFLESPLGFAGFHKYFA